MKPPPTNIAAEPSRAGEIIAALGGVTRTFDSYLTRAVADVSFEVRRGEVLGVIGPESSGKTTTLKILAGRLRPNEGKVRAFGRPPWRRAVRSRIGYLPGHNTRDQGLGWARSLREFFFGRKGRATTESWEAQRRFNLKQAILGNRELIVLDEPFVGLDETARMEISELMRSLAQRGRAIVLAGDSLFELRGVCDRFVVLYEGRIQAVGSWTELFSDPDAVRFFAPMLPRSLTERLLKVIEQEARDSGPATAASPAAAAPGDDESTTPKAADGVDHAKLAELARPEPPPGSEGAGK